MKMKKWFIQALLPMLLFGVSKLQAANWEPVQNIQQESSLITFSKIVCDDSGNAAAAWVEARNLYVSYRTAGGFWDPPSNPGSTKADLFDMCVDANGNVTIAAVALSSGGDQISPVFRAMGSSSWTTATPFSAGGAGNGTESISVACISSNTQAIAVWDNSTSNIVSSSYRSGTTWQSVLTVGGITTVDSTTRPLVRLLPNGNAELLMRTVVAGTEDIYRTDTTTPGGAWVGVTSTERLNFSTNIDEFQFAMNRSGNGVVVATENPGNVVFSYFTGGSWSATPGTLATVQAKAPQAGISGSGNVVGMWQTDTPTRIQAGTATLGAASWSVQDLGSGSVQDPALGVSNNGYMVAGWIADGNLYAQVGLNNSFESGSTILDPHSSVDAMCIGDAGTGYAIWSGGITGAEFVKSSRTINPYDALMQALGKKRLIYQKGMYP